MRTIKNGFNSCFCILRIWFLGLVVTSPRAVVGGGRTRKSPTLYDYFSEGSSPKGREEFVDSGLYEGGRPRLNFVKSHFLNDSFTRAKSLNELMEFYTVWVQTNEYMVLSREERFESKDFVVVNYSTFAVKSSKRGNDVYLWRLAKKLDIFRNSLGKCVLFDIHANHKKSNVLYITLTYDSKRCSLEEAWKNVGLEYNKWITNLRNKYGKIHTLRVWESFPDKRGSAYGYPHIHVIMFFENAEFDVFLYNKKWRIKDKAEFERGYHSNVDVQALRTLHKSVNYVLKYLSKSYLNQKSFYSSGKLTLSLCWLFRKHSYSISGSFFDLKCTKSNSNFKHQMFFDSECNLVESVVKWSIVGFFSAEELFNMYPRVNFYHSRLLLWSVILDKF